MTIICFEYTALFVKYGTQVENDLQSSLPRDARKNQGLASEWTATAEETHHVIYFRSHNLPPVTEACMCNGPVDQFKAATQKPIFHHPHNSNML
jgi:hypothetical protein